MRKDTYVNLIVVSSVNLIAAVVNVFLNALVIFAVATRRRLQINSIVLLACLAGTDLLAGLVAQPITVVVEVNRLLGGGSSCTLEKIQTVVIVAATFASLSHLVLISGDRYLAIRNPLRYQDNVTSQRLTLGVLLAWSSTVAVTIQETILAIFDSKTEIYSTYVQISTIILLTIVMLCIAFIVFTNGYIYSETRRQKKRMLTEQLPHEEVKRIKKEHKSANILAILLLALFLTYLPKIITVVLTVALSDIIEPRIFSLLWSWGSTFVLLGSLSNPIIYCWRLKKLRRTFLEILHLIQTENSPPQIGWTEAGRTLGPPVTNESSLPRAIRHQPVAKPVVLMSFRQMQAEDTTF